MGRHAVHVLRRAHTVDVPCHDVEIVEAAQQVDALACRQPAPRRRAYAGRARWIEHVHVEAQIDRPLADLVAELGHALGEPAAYQLVERHGLVAEAHGARHDALGIGRAADADMPGEFRIDQAFLGDVGELGGGVVLLLFAIRIGIGVRVDMERRHLRILLAHGAGDRDSDGAIAADRDGDGAGRDDAVDRLFGTLEGVDDLRRRELDVAAIDQPQRRHRVEVGVGGIEAPHQRRLLAHGVRTAACADPHVGAAIEGNAQDRRLVGRAGPPIGRAHEGHGQGEQLGIGQPVHGHCSAERRAQATSVWIFATARSSSTRTYSSGPPMLKGVSPSTTVGTPYRRYQRESEPPTRMFTAGVSPSTSAATCTVRRIISWLGSVKEASKRRIARQLTPASGASHSSSFCASKSVVTPTGSRISARAMAWVGTRLGEVPPSMVPIFTVTRESVWASPAPDSASEISLALLMASVTAAGAWKGMASSSFSRSSASLSRSMALLPRWTCAPCAGDPVASTSTHIRPFSPKRTILGEPTSPQMLASPRACGICSIM